MKKIIKFGVVLLMLTSVTFFLMAQLPSYRDTDRIQILNDALVAPDSLYVSWGDNEDVESRWLDDDGWLTFEKRVDSLFRKAPTTAGYRDPTSAVEYFDEFITLDTTGNAANSYEFDGITTDGTVWLATSSDLHSLTGRVYGAGGVLLLTSGTAGDSGMYNLQQGGEAFTVDSANGIENWFDIEIKLGDTTGLGVKLGLFPQDPDSLRSDSFNTGIYWEKETNTNQWVFGVSRTNSLVTRKTFAASIVSTTECTTGTEGWTRLGWYANGSGVVPFINGVEYADSVLTTNVPFDTLLTPSIETIWAGTLAVRYMRVIQEK